MERRSQRTLGIGDILGSRQTKEQRWYYKRLKKEARKGKPKENEATEEFQREMINNVKYCRVSQENEDLQASFWMQQLMSTVTITRPTYIVGDRSQQKVKKWTGCEEVEKEE